MPDQIEIKVNKSFASFKAGEVVALAAADGIPLDPYWQRRLRDSAIDGGCEVVQPKKTRAKKAEKPDLAGGSD